MVLLFVLVLLVPAIVNSVLMWVLIVIVLSRVLYGLGYELEAFLVVLHSMSTAGLLMSMYGMSVFPTMA